MKLDSGRPQDMADIARMLALSDDATLGKARDVIRWFARDSEAMEDFDSLLEIGRWELGPNRVSRRSNRVAWTAPVSTSRAATA